MIKALAASSRRRRGSAALICAAVVSSAVLAGCGSSGGGGTSGDAAKKSPIVIGGIGSVQLAALTGADGGFKARIASVNKAGGIDGHQIEFTRLYDDGGSPATDLSDVQQMILQYHVFAIFDAGSISIDQATINFAAAHHVPIFGYAFTPSSCGSKYFWPMVGGGCFIANSAIGQNALNGVVPTAVAEGSKQSVSSLKWAYIAENNEPVPNVSAFGGASIKAAGADPVYFENTMPATPPSDYTPYIQQMLNSKPNVVQAGIIFPEEVGVAQSLKAAGYKGIFYAESGLPSDMFTADAAAAAALNGSYQGSLFPTPQDNTPASKQEAASLTAAHVFSGGQAFGLGPEIGYWVGDQFISMLQATAKKGAVTAESLVNVVNSGSYVYHGPQGYIKSQSWPLSEQEPTAGCLSIQRVDTATKSFTLLVPFTCYPLTKVKSLPPLKQ